MTETQIEKTGERRYALDPAEVRDGARGTTLAELRAILADVIDALALGDGGGW